MNKTLTLTPEQVEVLTEVIDYAIDGLDMDNMDAIDRLSKIKEALENDLQA